MFYSLILLLIGLDQISKFAIQRYLLLNQSITIIPGILSLTYICNPGAAFGLFPHQTVFLIIFTLCLFVLAFFFRIKISESPLLFRLGLSLGIGGAAGNLIDRIRMGSVIDFLDLDFWPLKNFPIFNLADSAIVVGVIIIFIYLYLIEN